jgi:hypothetical protein
MLPQALGSSGFNYALFGIRLPTGDERNFLGSGTLGLKPFTVASYRGRISPHGEVGYGLNGNSLLYGNFIATPTVTKSGLAFPFLVCCRRECCGHEATHSRLRSL